MAKVSKMVSVAMEIRSLMPFGPVWETHALAVGSKLGVTGQVVINVASGLSNVSKSYIPKTDAWGNPLPFWLANKQLESERRKLFHEELNRMMPGLLSEQGFRCRYCRSTVFSYGAQKDFKVPPSEGGGGDIGNVVLLCQRCYNQKRGRSERKFQAVRAVWALNDCQCGPAGCPLGCQGCEVCGHDPGYPLKIVCPARLVKSARRGCDSPTTCQGNGCRELVKYFPVQSGPVQSGSEVC